MLAPDLKPRLRDVVLNEVVYARDLRLYLEDILEACDPVTSYTAQVDFLTFAADRMRIDAVVRNLEIIGEAVKNIPEAQRALAPSVEWRKIAGLRDVVAHQYVAVNLTILWDLIQHRIAPLQQEVTALLRGLGEDCRTHRCAVPECDATRARRSLTSAFAAQVPMLASPNRSPRHSPRRSRHH